MYRKLCEVIVVLLFGTYLVVTAGVLPAENSMIVNEDATDEANTATLRSGVFADFDRDIYQKGYVDVSLQLPYMTAEEKANQVYTFLQGPQAWAAGQPWSGEWCQFYIKKRSFGGFGCGFCCMANIYSTLSPYECSPMDMFEFSTHVSNYYPSRESGAIGWEDMQSVLVAAGMNSQLCNKPLTYEEFQNQMRSTKSAIVLVNSGDDATFWSNTQGHYVNIWLYQPDSDMVFLAEPGDPVNNRTWIPLRYVYDALKTVSQYQYLAVTEYQEEQNGWKGNGIDDNWIRPN